MLKKIYILSFIVICLFCQYAYTADHLILAEVSQRGKLLRTHFYFFRYSSHFCHNCTCKRLCANADYLQITLSPSGKIEAVYVKVPGAFVNVHEDGSVTIVETKATARIEYKKNRLWRIVYRNKGRKTYSSFEYYQGNNFKKGKIFKIGKFEFRYYSVDDFRRGKLSEVDNVDISYYRGANSNAGKIAEIGKWRLEYYNPESRHPEKLYRIGSYDFTYYQDARLKEIERIRFYYHDDGTIKELSGNNSSRFIVEIY